MHVYVIGMLNSNSIGEEPYITPPYLHSNFISELTKEYEMMSDELGVPFRRKDKVTKIEDITEDFLLAQPTGKKIYINSMSCSRYYLYFIPYEILDTDLKPGKKLSHKTQLYNLGWLIEEKEIEPTKKDVSRIASDEEYHQPIIIHTDPLLTTLRIRHLGTGELGATPGFTLKSLHEITGECMIYTYPDKFYKIRKCLMAAH
jgi:hypothetical protein